MANKIDSNITGLRFAEEASLKVLPGSPVWYPLEPNSYSDFGGQIKTIARNPINASRQRKKGVTTDLDASGSFNQDLTLTNMTRLLQAFMFADIREKKKTNGMNAVADTVASVTSGTKTFALSAGGVGFLAGHLVETNGFSTPANNGIFTVSANATATALITTESPVTEAAPPAGASIAVVGFQFPSADVSITMNGNLVRLTSVATAMTGLGLIPGEWIYIGGDAVGTTLAINKGFARISSIGALYLEFDKISWTGAIAEVGTGKTLRIFYGDVLKNESTPALIKRRTLQVERTLGDDSGVQSEYLVGAVTNEFTMNISQADKVTTDLSFIAVDNEQRTGAVGVKVGTRPSIVDSAAFNTSSDITRIKLSLVSATDPAPTPLFAFATEMSLGVKNNVTPNKAIGVLGAFDTSSGTFEVSGSMTAYFASVTAVQAVRNNADVTLDMIMLKKNNALLWDIPLLSLGDGRLSVEQDKSITLPLETNAAESKFGHTLLFQVFGYLPDAAGGV